MASSTALNLKAITEALNTHDEGCSGEIIEIRMNPFEVERLGWDEIRGVPIVCDGDIGTGRFRLICERDRLGHVGEVQEAVQEKVPAGGVR